MSEEGRDFPELSIKKIDNSMKDIIKNKNMFL